jgi:hypothetical protein
VPLYKHCHLKISEPNLLLATSYGLAGKTISSMRAMVNKLLESIYPRETLGSHTISGSLPRVPRNANPDEQLAAKSTAKPALPAEDVDAITGLIYDYQLPIHSITILLLFFL